MRSYVVKRLPHFRHSRRRRMESASLLSRESTTLSFANPQKGHFMGLVGQLVIVTGDACRKVSALGDGALRILCALCGYSLRSPRFKNLPLLISHLNQPLPPPPSRSPPPPSATTTSHDVRTKAQPAQSPQNSPAKSESRSSPPVPAECRKLCSALQWSPAAPRRPRPVVATAIPPCPIPIAATPWSHSSPASAPHRRGRLPHNWRQSSTTSRATPPRLARAPTTRGWYASPRQIPAIAGRSGGLIPSPDAKSAFPPNPRRSALDNGPQTSP